MVKLRLTRTGRKNYATFRLVAVPERTKRDTKAIEELGYYLPHDKKSDFNKERITYWLSVGAQPSPTVARLLAKAGLLDESKLEKKTFQGKPGKKAKERADKKAAKAEAASAAEAAPVAEEAPAAETTEETKAE
jgi:small subunit ribosomal protein S16